MKGIKTLSAVEWPDSDIQKNFKFTAVHPDGSFVFTFRWFNDRWNAWCELPGGEIRGVGVEPDVCSWVGFTDYGIIFDTELPKIDYPSLFLTKLYIITWE